MQNSSDVHVLKKYFYNGLLVILVLYALSETRRNNKYTTFSIFGIYPSLNESTLLGMLLLDHCNCLGSRALCKVLPKECLIARAFIDTEDEE